MTAKTTVKTTPGALVPPPGRHLVLASTSRYRRMLLERLGNTVRSRMLLDRALALAPADVNALTARGALELKEGSAPAGQRMMSSAHEQLGSPASANNLAAALLLAGDHAAARDLLQKVDPANAPPELFANLASADLFAGDLEAAKKNLQFALKR